MRNEIIFFHYFLFCLAVHSFAQKDSLSRESTRSDKSIDVFSMSMEDLMNVKVTIASKSSEKIQQAPAIITVMSSREIEGFGFKSLADLLDRLSSTYMISTSFAQTGMRVIRGKQTEHYNTNVLILIDGRPLRESFHGGYNGVIYSMVPVNSLERIEMIRGPGSVLYGSNAYVGVINLITKKGSDNKIHCTIRFGSFNMVQALVSANKTYKDLQIAFAVNSLQTDAWDFTVREKTML